MLGPSSLFLAQRNDVSQRCNCELFPFGCLFILFDLKSWFFKREPLLLKELKKIKEPEQEYSVYRKIWLPKNWIVKVKEDGNSGDEPIQVAGPVVFEKEFYQQSASNEAVSFPLIFGYLNNC
jgi:hypothetical protein